MFFPIHLSLVVGTCSITLLTYKIKGTGPGGDKMIISMISNMKSIFCNMHLFVSKKLHKTEPFL